MFLRTMAFVYLMNRYILQRDAIKPILFALAPLSPTLRAGSQSTAFHYSIIPIAERSGAKFV
jgi:hypothetical protein